MKRFGYLYRSFAIAALAIIQLITVPVALAKIDQASIRDPLPKDVKYLIADVSIDKANGVVVHVDGKAGSVPEFEAQLKSRLKESPQVRLEIRATAELQYGQLQDVLIAAAKAQVVGGKLMLNGKGSHPFIFPAKGNEEEPETTVVEAFVRRKDRELQTTVGKHTSRGIGPDFQKNLKQVREAVKAAEKKEPSILLIFSTDTSFKDVFEAYGMCIDAGYEYLAFGVGVDPVHEEVEK